MSNNKIYKKGNCDNVDWDTLLSPCFEIGSDVTFKDVPTTGEEYLLKVKREREKYSIVSKCNRDYSKFAHNQSQFIKELPHAKAPDNLKPTIEWQNIQVADFSDVRMYISRLSNKKTAWPQGSEQLQIDPADIKAWKHLFQTKDSTLSSVIGIHQALVDRGLEILIDMLDDVKIGNTITHKTGQWIYALLARTRQPLVSDTVSILRNLARKCAEIRSHINPEDENARLDAAPLNLFVCLVARYFRQYDLAD